MAWRLWSTKRKPGGVNQLKWKKIEEQRIGLVCFNSAPSYKRQLREVCFSFCFPDKVLFSLCLTICLPWGWCWLFSVSLILSPSLPILKEREFRSKAVFANSFYIWTLLSFPRSSLLGWLKLYLTWKISWKNKWIRKSMNVKGQANERISSAPYPETR